MSLLGIASDQVYAVSPQDTLAHVRNVFVKRGVSHVLVYDTKVRGMVTDNDLANALLRERRSIDAIPVSQVMSKNVITVTPDGSPQEVARLMSEKHISGIPVVKGGDVLGIVTKTDLTRHFAENFTGFASVGELMSTTPKTIQEFQSIFHAANEMKRKHVKRLVVMRDKKPAGMVSERDLSLATFGLRPSRVVFSRTGRSGMPHRNVYTYPLVVADIMQTSLVTADPDEDAGKVAKRILDKGVGSAIVTRRERLAGIITKTDYTRWLALRKE